MVKEITIDVDLKKQNYLSNHQARHGDKTPLILNVLDDGQPFDLTNIQTVSLAVTRLDREVIVLNGVSSGSAATFELGGSELSVPGRIEATAQFYDVDGRVSTVNFNLVAIKDPTGKGFTPSETESTLIEVVLSDGPLRIQEAIDAGVYALDQGDYAKLQGDYVETQKPIIDTFTGEQTNLQAQIDVLVVDGDSSPESAQARVGSDAITYPTLKARLDAEQNKTIGQLAEKAKQTDLNATNANVALKSDKTYVDSQLNNIGVLQINKNKGLIDQTYLSDSLKQQIAGTAPINAVPANDSITNKKHVDKSIEYEKQNFLKVSTSNKNLFDGVYYKRWVASDTKIYSKIDAASLAIIPILPGKSYNIQTTGTHNRFTVSLMNDIDAFGTTANVLYANNATTGNEQYKFRNTNYKYLAIGVSNTNTAPKLAVTCTNDKVSMDETKKEELATYFANYWINYQTTVVSSVATQRSLVYPIEQNCEITIQTTGVHDRFVVGVTDQIYNGVSSTILYTGSNGDGLSTGNELFTFNNTTGKYLVIGITSTSQKPFVHVTQRFRNNIEINTTNNQKSTGIEKTKEIHPVMFGVKMSNERDKSLGFSETPRPVGWLYYTPEQPYKLLYANGSPENMRYLCTWNESITWNGKSTPEQYRPFITKDGDIIFVWRGDLLGLGTEIDPNGRQNPIVYPANNWDNPVVVDLGAGAKPTSWLQNCGADFLYNQNTFIFAEYTRPLHGVANIWKVTKPFTNPSNWKTVMTLQLSGSNQTGMKHFHTINYDPFSGKVFATTGDDDIAAKIYMSSDYGETWTIVLEGTNRYARVTNFIFTKNKVFWANDDALHGFYSVNRDVEGVPDFTNITTLYDLSGQPPTYVNCLVEDPYGILLLDRFDGDSAGPLKVHFWDIKTSTMHVLKEIYPTGGVAKTFGFKVDAVSYYQPKGSNKIVVGFGNPKNDMDLLNNTTSVSNADRINNLVLEVIKIGTTYDLKISAINDRSI